MRLRIKRIVKLSFITLAFPLYGLFLLLARIGDEDAVFQGFSQVLSLIPGKIGIYYRAAFFKLACPNTSDEISVGFLTLLSHRDTTIRKGVYIGPQCNIGKCTIGENTLLGSGVHILSGKNQHDFSSLEKPIQHQGGTYTKIEIGSDCWLGNGSLVMANIADQCIVAAGSVVIRNIDTAATIVAGNPAKFIKSRTESLSADTNLSSHQRKPT